MSSLSELDITKIGNMLDERLSKVMPCEMHKQTLYGADGRSGLVRDVQDIQKKVNRVTISQAILNGGLAVIIFFRDKIFP